MSLDNVLGVAAAAKGNLVLLILGLALSIPLIIYGSTFILKLMNRVPAIITLGGGVLGWVAGEMAIADPVVGPFVQGDAEWVHGAAPLLGAILVVVVGTMMAKRRAIVSADGSTDVPVPAAVVEADLAREEASAPPGYQWVSRPWRTLPDGTREYAASYGKTAFRFLAPVSSHLRSSRH
jgi:hypothetical protein